MHITRREFCLSTSAIVLAATVLPPFARPAWADNVPVADLMKPDAQPDLALGSEKAPVTIVEYASMTCPHCAHFEEMTFPDLKKRYIDTGKVRFILRDFPLDSLAGAAFVLAHCASKGDAGKYYSMVETLFSQQRTWAVEKPIPPLMAIAKQAGLSEKEFNDCLSNQKAWDAMESVRQRAMKEFKVEVDADIFHQRDESDRRRLDRGFRQGHRPLSQGRIRVFRPKPGPCGGAFFGPRGAERSGKPQVCLAGLLLIRARRFILRPMRHMSTGLRGYPPDGITILPNVTTRASTGEAFARRTTPDYSRPEL